MSPVRVLFLCTGNSCRSQMAEGILRHLGNDAVEVVSAGTHPQPIHPEAIRCLAEIGVDISSQCSKPLGPFLGERFDYVVTVCDRARQACPVFPGASQSLHWDIPDPAEAPGSEAERRAFFRRVREKLLARIQFLLQAIVDQWLEEAARHPQTPGSS